MATNKTVTVTTIPTLTGDTVASYNVYEGVSGTTLLGTMTPAEASAGKVFAFTDGIVHSVKVQTVWTTAGASTLRSTGVPLDLSGSIIVAFDDFFGTTVDPNWEVTDTTSANTSMAQDGSYLFTQLNTSVQTSIAESMIKWGAGINIANDWAFSANIQYDENGGTLYNNFYMALSKSDLAVNTDDIIRLQEPQSDTSGNTATVVKEGGTVTLNSEQVGDVQAAMTTMKIANNSGTITFSRWNGTSWDVLSTVANSSTGTYYAYFLFWTGLGSGATGANFRVNDFYLTTEDFTTRYPV